MDTKKNLRLVAIWILGGIPVCGLAQLNVSLLKDDPNKLEPISIIIDPWMMDTWKPNLVLGGGGFGIVAHIGKAVDFEWLNHFSYWERNYNAGYTGANHNDIGRYNNEEMVLGINLGSGYSKRNYRVTVNSYDNGSYTYFLQELDKRVCVTLRAGACHMGTSYHGGDIGAYTLNGYGGTNTVDYSMMDQGFAIAGLSFKVIHNGLVSIGGFKKSEAGWMEFYADALPMFAMSLGRLGPKDTTVIHTKSMSNLGARAGFRYLDPSRSMITLGVEVGSRPGPTGQGGYILASMGFALTPHNKW